MFDLLFNTNSAILASLTVSILCVFLLCYVSLSASRPAWCGILGQRPTTSAVTTMVFSGNAENRFFINIWKYWQFITSLLNIFL